ncbi:ABC transporter permease [Parabacteroides sp. APC149_11_2_Y6]
MIISNYWNSAWRSLTKKKGFSAINITGLAIGMAAALLILTYVAFEYSYDNMHRNQDRIFRVEARFYENGELTDDWASSSAGYVPAMKRNMAGIEDVTRVGSQYYPEQIVKYNELLYRETGIGYAEANFFNFFDFKLLKGDKNTCLEGPNKVVITERIARKYFKGENPMGKILIFRSNIGEEACEVSGIMEDMPVNSHTRYSMLISYKTLPKWMDEYWYRHEVYSYVLLKSANLKKQVEDAFPEMAEKYKTDEALKNKTWAVQLVNLRDIHLNRQKSYEPEIKGNSSSLLVLICTALAILCIAWINYINMTVARSMERAREIGIRRASGASRRQIVSQFLFEALVTNGIAFILALGIMEALMPAFNNLTGRDLSFSVWITTPLGWLLLLVFAIGVFLSGFYPAMVLSGIRPLKMLKGKFTHTRGATITRKVLVVLQYTASLTLLCGTLIVYAQLQYMRNASLGVRTDQTLVLKFPAKCEGLETKLEAMKKEIALLPSVKAVTVSGAVPGTEVTDFLSIVRENDVTKQTRLLEMLNCDPYFLDAYDLKFVAGRGFSEDFGGDVYNIVLNEAAVRTLGFESPEKALGERLSVETVDQPMQIIGVVKNYHQQSLNKDYTPILFALHDKLSWMKQRYISVVMEDANPRELTKQVETVWNRYFPDSSYDYFFLDQFFDQQYRQDEVFGLIVALFAALAIFISCMGLWVLVMFSCSTRIREMGIRKVLGASKMQLFCELGREFFVLIGIAIVIALPLSWWIMNGWLSYYSFRTDWKIWFFVVPVVLLCVISLLTIAWQTAKTIFSKPARSLRYE